ncbi:MAG TPA: hypothetical protein VMP41_03455 [Acidimicrobiales bacterium]|nr:hypothetical protein [Acidimicrobiales bacterium]
MKRFYTAVARKSEVRSEHAPVSTPLGLQFPAGTPLKLLGSRHAPNDEGTLCGIPAEEIVYVGTAFAPDVPGACLVCMAEAEQLDLEDDRPDEPYQFHAPPDTWMAEWEPDMIREWEKVWRREEPRTIDLLLGLNRLWNLQESLEKVAAALEKGGYRLPLPTASQIEVLARLGMAEFRRLTNS